MCIVIIHAGKYIVVALYQKGTNYALDGNFLLRVGQR